VNPELVSHCLLGLAYLGAGRPDEAIAKFEELLSSYSDKLLYTGVYGVKLHYYLGQAYEQSQKYDQAAAQYETFLEIWKDADSGLTGIDDARRRLAGLKSRS
jgi:tetratricopeptide (TPR) repeat protein